MTCQQMGHTKKGCASPKHSNDTTYFLGNKKEHVARTSAKLRLKVCPSEGIVMGSKAEAPLDLLGLGIKTWHWVQNHICPLW